MLLMLLLGILQIAGPAGHNLVQESKTQAQYYIGNIQSGINVDANTWALTTLTSDNDQIRSFVEREVREKAHSNNKLLSQFEEISSSYSDQLSRIVFNSGSSNLLIALLLSLENKREREEIYNEFISQFDHPRNDPTDYASLSKSIIDGEKISEASLPNNKFYLSHLFVLFDDDYKKFVSNQYLEGIAQQYKSIGSSSEEHITKTFSSVIHFRVLYLLDRYSQMNDLYNQLANNELFPTSTLKLRIYRYLDYSMYRLGYYDRSLKVTRKFTLPLSTYLNRKQLELSIKQLQGVYLYHIGKIHEAEKKYQEVITEINRSNLETNLSSTYNNLALTYYKLGKYDQYLELQFQALEIAEKASNYSHQLEIFKNLFLYFKNNNDRDNTLNYLLKAQNIAKDYNNTNDLGNTYILLGIFYREFDNNFKRSLESFKKAEKLIDTKNHVSDFVNLLNEHAQTLNKQNSYLQALEKYDQIIKITSKKESPFYVDALVNKALTNLKMGNNERGLEYIKKFKSLNLSKLDFDKLIKAKTVEADYLNQTGEPRKALDILEPSLAQIVVRAKGSTDLKSGFWHVEDEYLDTFELAISIYKKIGAPGKAVEKLDQLKTINDASYYQNPLVKSSLLNESELTQYKKLTQQLDASRKQLLTAPEKQQFDIRQTISQLKLKKRKLDRKLTKDISSDNISVREVQNKLSAHELVFHITELKDQYYIAQISRSDVTINTIPLDSDLRSLLSNSTQQIATNKTNLDSLYTISRMLGIGDIPNRIEQITIIPDSYFYQLPIDVLPLDKPDKSYSYGEVTYVIEQFRTQYLTSLNDFKNPTSEQPAKPNQLSYVGYGVSNFSGYNNKSLVPLPHAQTEVTSIANKLTHLPSTQTYLNEQSTKSTFTQTAPGARIIHLATHSEVSERDPMFSTVYLSKATSSPDSTFDDQVFAYELFELDLSNEMIMLNSCESGSGSYIQGTGVMGISRALQYAGARSLVLNLWSVNDMLASDFAIHFYDQLNQGKSKAEALQNTKRYFLRTKNASPHFWGPYMLIGNTEPIVQPNQDKNLAMAGAFIFYFLLMVGLSYLTQQGIIFRNRDNRLN